MNYENAKSIIADLRKAEWQYTSSDQAKDSYLKDHSYRFNWIFSFCSELLPQKQSRVLDVGQSYLTKMLADYYENVWTIGLDPEVDAGGHRSNSSDQPKIPHITFDLNNAKLIDRWPPIDQRFDLIVYSETIEHLTAAPEYSLLFLSCLLSPNGILVVTTPNAVTLSKRIKFIFGRNPFEQLRLLSENPGHYREYTLRELSEIGARCKLSIHSMRHVNFGNQGRIVKLLFKNLSAAFRDSLVICFRSEDSPDSGS